MDDRNLRTILEAYPSLKHKASEVDEWVTRRDTSIALRTQLLWPVLALFLATIIQGYWLNYLSLVAFSAAWIRVDDRVRSAREHLRDIRDLARERLEEMYELEASVAWTTAHDDGCGLIWRQLSTDGEQTISRLEFHLSLLK